MQLDQAVVAPSPTDGLLLALAPGDVELEGGPGVVVEAADQPGFELVGHVQRVQVRTDAGEMLRAGIAQAIGDLGRGLVERGHRRIVRVEQAQDVPLQPVALQLGKLGDVRAEVVGQLGDVGRPAGRVADRIEVDDDAVESRLPIEARCRAR